MTHASSKMLPPEIITLVFEEFDYDVESLRKCSLVCKSWRSLALPFLFHHICLPDGETFLNAFHLLVVDAPHIGQYVREIMIGQSSRYSQPGGVPLPEANKERLEALFLSLPRLKVLHCGFGAHLVMPPALVRPSITTLHIHGTIQPLSYFLMVLQSAAETIRFLTLRNMSYLAVPPGSLRWRTMSSPSRMLALEELCIVWCDGLSFPPSTLQMPNLRTLVLDNSDESILPCVPVSLETLVIHIDPDIPLPPNRLLNVENVVAFCYIIDADDQLSERALANFCVTSAIKRLEVMLLFLDGLNDTLSSFASMVDEGFETDMLRLHRHGSLQQVIVSSKFCSEGPLESKRRLPKGTTLVNTMGATEQGPAAASGDDIDPRSVYEIVWSCVAVVFACTWVAIHPNVPPKHIRTSRWRRLRRRVCLMIWALLVPELMVMWAVGQWSSADIVSREFGDKLKGKDKKSTRAHGFFLVMGGFSSFRRGQSVPGTSSIDDAPPDAVEVRRIYPEDLYGNPLNPLIDRRIPCPGITRDRIDDKSKGDGLAKALVVLQTTWFVLQVLFRFVENIAITELEIVTLAYAMMGGMMYVFWWNKPLDVLLPVPVYTAVYRVGRTESVSWWNQPLNVLLPLPMYTSTAQYLAGRPNMARSVFESSRWIDRAVEIIKGETILRLHAKVVDEPTSMFTSLMTPHQAHERLTVASSGPYTALPRSSTARRRWRGSCGWCPRCW
ncbi:hypothetical protein EYR38_004972 [Pleurotus pulmonarius]|nr:hypothetical protein EYR38_004972 [Pleurotus pulmonarius]